MGAMKMRIILELLRIVFIFVLLGGMLFSIVDHYYTELGVFTDRYGWMSIPAIFILLFVLYRNKLQFSGWYVGKGREQLSKIVSKLLIFSSIVLLTLPLILSEFFVSPASLELVSFNVELVERKINTEEKVGPTLEYSFTLKNTGNKTVGGITEKTRIDTKIIPNEKLIKVSEEVMWKNIYDGIYSQNGVFVGTPIVRGLVYPLLPNTEAEYSIGYYLGPFEEYEFRKVAPTREQVEELKKHAVDATLVILVKDKEVARFDLRNEVGGYHK